MALYRVLKALTTGHQVGDIVDGARFRYLDALVKCGALVSVNPPPLALVPGWSERRELLPPDAQTVEAMIAAPAAEIAVACGVDAPTAELWQSEALEFLKPSKECKTCRG